MLRLLLLSVSILFLSVAADAKRIALVIGNDSYASLQPLEKARNDATAIRDLLVSKEFEVLFKPDTDLTDFKQSLFDFSAKIEPEDIVVFYYAGHGVALNGVNYLMPIDVPLPSVSDPDNLQNLKEEDVRAEQERLAEFSVKESLVLGQIAKRKPKVSLVILDNCRNNPLRVEDAGDSPFRDAASGDIVFGTGTNTAEKKQPEGMIIVYSASFGQRALDSIPGNEKAPNSPFTTAFLENFRTPGLGLKQVIQKTREDVYRLAKAVKHDQSPAVYDQLFGGDVYLSGEPSEADLALNSAVPVDPLTSDFKLAQSLGSKTGWEAFLSRHGSTADMRVDLGKKELEKLALVVVPEVPVAQDGKSDLQVRDASAATQCDRLAAPVDDVTIGIKATPVAAIRAAEAVPACREALALFPAEPRFMMQLGRALLNSKEYVEAASWFDKSATAGNSFAMTNLGQMFGAGLGVKRDIFTAYAWTKKAAEAGNVLGMYNLGTLYYLGKGVAKDPKQAFIWFKNAADSGNVDAYTAIGLMEERGIGREKNIVSAIDNYRYAAEGGDANAMHHLARVYQLGIGVPKDLKESAKWRKQAEKADAK